MIKSDLPLEKLCKTRNKPKISKYNFMGNSIPLEEAISNQNFFKHTFPKSKSLKLILSPTNKRDLLKEAITEVEKDDFTKFSEKKIKNLGQKLFSPQKGSTKLIKPEHFQFFPNDSFGNENNNIITPNVVSVVLDNKIETVFKILNIDKNKVQFNKDMNIYEVMQMTNSDISKLKMDINDKKKLSHFIVLFDKYMKKYSIKNDLIIGDIVKFFEENKKLIINKKYFNSLSGNSNKNVMYMSPKQKFLVSSPSAKFTDEVFIPSNDYGLSSPSATRPAVTVKGHRRNRTATLPPQKKSKTHIHKFNPNIKQKLIAERLLKKYEVLTKEVELYFHQTSKKM